MLSYGANGSVQAVQNGDLLTPKMKAVGSYNVSGTSDPMAQHHAPEHFYVPQQFRSLDESHTVRSNTVKYI